MSLHNELETAPRMITLGAIRKTGGEPRRPNAVQARPVHREAFPHAQTTALTMITLGANRPSGVELKAHNAADVRAQICRFVTHLWGNWRFVVVWAA